MTKIRKKLIASGKALWTESEIAAIERALVGLWGQTANRSWPESVAQESTVSELLREVV